MNSDRKFPALQALGHIWSPAAPALISATAAIFLYAVTLGGTYVYDDVVIVRDDPRVHQISLWKELWTKDYFDGGIDNLYRPIVSTSYAIEWFLHGNRPWLFHAVNILLHALACGLVAEFTRRLLGSWPRAPAAAICAGLLFAVHPVHVEAVANIVGRAELACTAGIFAALVILCRRPLTTGGAIGAIVFGVIALLCKEQGMLQPLIWFFLLFNLTRFRHIAPNLVRPRRREIAQRSSRRNQKGESNTETRRHREEKKEQSDKPISSRYPPTTLSPAWSLLLRASVSPCLIRRSKTRNLGISMKEDAMTKQKSVVLFALSRLVGRISGSSPGTIETDAQSNTAAVKILILFTCWIWAIYIVGREHFLKFEWDRSLMDSTIQPMVHSFGTDRILMPVVLLGRYTALLFWPAHLSPDYGANVIGSIAHLDDPYLWIGFFSIATWLAATTWAWITSRRAILFCLLSLAMSYGLIGNILTLIGTIFAERLLYLPSAFFLIIAGIAVAKIPFKPRLLVMAVILAPASFRTFTAARLWNDPMQLYQTALKNQPQSLQLRLLIAQQLHQVADEPAAAAMLAEACRLYPKSSKAWIYRANQAMDAGRLDDAENDLERARKLEFNTNLLGPQERLAKLMAGRARENPK